MRIRRPVFIAVLVIALALSVIGGWLLSGDTSPTYTLGEPTGSIALNKVSEGRVLAAVDVTDINNNEVSTATWLGERLIINFWFSTCDPCRREFPVLVDADLRLPEIRVIGVNLNDSPEVAKEFMQQFGAVFDTYFDRDGRLSSALGIATAPITLLVDEGGLVRRQLTGEITRAILDTALAEVFPS